MSFISSKDSVVWGKTKVFFPLKVKKKKKKGINQIMPLDFQIKASEVKNERNRLKSKLCFLGAYKEKQQDSGIPQR